MTDLLTRLEQAKEGSRELDAEIHCHVHKGQRMTHPKLPRGYTMTDLGNKARNENRARSQFIHSDRGPAPHYTTSLDAALTLVPPNHEWSAGNDAENQKGWAKVGKEVWDENFDEYVVVSATPALALCIAALRARG